MVALISGPAIQGFLWLPSEFRSAWDTGDPVSTKQSMGILSLQERFRFSLSFDTLETNRGMFLSNSGAFSWIAIHTENHLRRGSSGIRSDPQKPTVTKLHRWTVSGVRHLVTGFPTFSMKPLLRTAKKSLTCNCLVRGSREPTYHCFYHNALERFYLEKLV